MHSDWQTHQQHQLFSNLPCCQSHTGILLFNQVRWPCAIVTMTTRIRCTGVSVVHDKIAVQSGKNTGMSWSVPWPICGSSRQTNFANWIFQQSSRSSTNSSIAWTVFFISINNRLWNDHKETYALFAPLFQVTGTDMHHDLWSVIKDGLLSTPNHLIVKTLPDYLS